LTEVVIGITMRAGKNATFASPGVNKGDATKRPSNWTLGRRRGALRLPKVREHRRVILGAFQSRDTSRSRKEET
jgi:hypothetical protein